MGGEFKMVLQEDSEFTFYRHNKYTTANGVIFSETVPKTE